MISATEYTQFESEGYVLVRNLLTPEEICILRKAFDAVWAKSGGQACDQFEMLNHEELLQLIEHPRILERLRVVFGHQLQLLQCELYDGTFNPKVHGDASSCPSRSWHRDFTFPGDYPLSINTILYLDVINNSSGPTYLMPGTHIGSRLPPEDNTNSPMLGELEIHAGPGDVLFLNSAVWHSGSFNMTSGRRRCIYLYYGYWWLKRYDEGEELPAKVYQYASDNLLTLLGKRKPEGDLHMYQPVTPPAVK